MQPECNRTIVGCEKNTKTSHKVVKTRHKIYNELSILQKMDLQIKLSTTNFNYMHTEIVAI